MFFDKNGILNLDEAVADVPSFKDIMADGIVTEDELQTQAGHVVNLLHDIEGKFSDDQLKEIKELLTETSVLYTAYNVYKLQNLKF